MLIAIRVVAGVGIPMIFMEFPFMLSALIPAVMLESGQLTF